MPTVERSNLHVEGRNDVHAIKHLLLRHGFDCPTKSDPRSGDEFAENVPEIKAAGDRSKVLDAMKTAVPVSTGRSVGFVLDADAVAENRWQAVRDRLGTFELNLPDSIPEDGFVGDIAEFKVRVGVWLMPDNRRSGALEQFLQDLIEEGNLLLPVAVRSTENAKAEGADFPESSRNKAVLHAWLAWQETPGLPYGLAIRARYFRADSPAATAFVQWYRNVFGDT